MGGFPRLYAAASLKHEALLRDFPRARRFSAALCRGLIEAISPPRSPHPPPSSFPRLYAAASLKRHHHGGPAHGDRGFPRLYAAASLKHSLCSSIGSLSARFPRLYAAASLKPAHGDQRQRALSRFPRLYAAASLKRVVDPDMANWHGHVFSAALCRGLIEALSVGVCLDCGFHVFRGFMPRPH